MASHRITDRGQNPCSSARSCAAPGGLVHGAGTCACAGAPACAIAGLPDDTSDRPASCSPASPLGAASRGSSGSQIAAARARSRGCATAAPIDPERCFSHTTRSARSRRAAALCAPSPRNAPESTGPAHDGAPASELFSDHLAQDVLIEREIGYETLQARVLITQLAQLVDLGEPELRVLLLPEVKARLAHPDLTAHIRHRCAAFRLAQCHGNLLIRKTLPLHGPLLPIWRTSEVQLSPVLNRPEIGNEVNIIRNRMKIEAAVRDARAFRKVQQEFGKFDAYCWQFVGGRPRLNRWKSTRQIPATTPESEALSKDLKRRGFSFVGPTVA